MARIRRMARGKEAEGGGGAGAALLLTREAAPPASASPERRRFMSLLAHEVRAPLAAIKSYSEILLTCPPADAQARKDFLKAISDETERIHRLLDDVIEVERLEGGHSVFVPTPCDLMDLLERAALGAHPLASAKKLDLACEKVGEPGLVPGEPHLLLKAVSALVDNAVKFSPIEGRVRARLVAWEESDRLSIEVEDEGAGIPEAAVPRIYDKFFQAAVPPDDVSPRGAGLGLTLVKLIAERHDGTIEYRRRPRGSAFVLTLGRP